MNRTVQNAKKNKIDTYTDIFDNLTKNNLIPINGTKNNKKNNNDTKQNYNLQTNKNSIVDSDDKDQIIKKLIIITEQLKEEIKELRFHIEGTYCTSVEFNRYRDTIEKEILDAEIRIDNLEAKIDN